jgi:hypothetical protein
MEDSLTVFEIDCMKLDSAGFWRKSKFSLQLTTIAKFFLTMKIPTSSSDSYLTHATRPSLQEYKTGWYVENLNILTSSCQDIRPARHTRSIEEVCRKPEHSHILVPSHKAGAPHEDEKGGGEL